MANEREQDKSSDQDERTSGLGLHDEPNTDSAPGQSSASDWDRSGTKPAGARATRPRGEPKNVSDEDPKP
jgi:hypothetical protein